MEKSYRIIATKRNNKWTKNIKVRDKEGIAEIFKCGQGS